MIKYVTFCLARQIHYVSSRLSRRMNKVFQNLSSLVDQMQYIRLNQSCTSDTVWLSQSCSLALTDLHVRYIHYASLSIFQVWYIRCSTTLSVVHVSQVMIMYVFYCHIEYVSSNLPSLVQQTYYVSVGLARLVSVDKLLLPSSCTSHTVRLCSSCASPANSVNSLIYQQQHLIRSRKLCLCLM